MYSGQAGDHFALIPPLIYPRMKTVAMAYWPFDAGHTCANPQLTIFHHGRIFTSDPPHPLIDDGGVAVLGNLVIKAGSSEGW